MAGGARARKLGGASGGKPSAEATPLSSASPPAAASGGVLLARRGLVALLAALTGLASLLVARWRAGPGSQEPAVYSYRLVQRYPHDPLAFTQGLLWLNGSLYESTGLYGRSGVREVRLGKKGGMKVVREERLGQEDFGEGLVYWRGELLQLLWRRPEGRRYSALAGKGGHLKRKTGEDFKTALGDGWGLASDGEVLLATDSGSDIFHLDPDTFEVRRTVPVTDAGKLVEMVNELEMIEGELWGNIFGNECLARIDPYTGAVRGWVVLAGILDRRSATQEARKAGRDAPDVLNGIAWDPTDRRLFVTGKLWPSLFEIEVVPHPTMSLEDARGLCIPKRNIFRNGHA